MDWKLIVAELKAHGLTQPQIAAVCGCRQTTISALATGKTAEPSHSLGEALKNLLADKRGGPLPPPAGALTLVDRRDTSRPSPYANTDLDRRAPATVEGEG